MIHHPDRPLTLILLAIIGLMLWIIYLCPINP